MKDNGGWSSKGYELACPKCGETGMLLETTIYGKTTISYFCNLCAKDWTQPREIKEVGGR